MNNTLTISSKELIDLMTTVRGIRITLDDCLIRLIKTAEKIDEKDPIRLELINIIFPFISACLELNGKVFVHRLYPWLCRLNPSQEELNEIMEGEIVLSFPRD